MIISMSLKEVFKCLSLDTFVVLEESSESRLKEIDDYRIGDTILVDIVDIDEYELDGIMIQVIDEFVNALMSKYVLTGTLQHVNNVISIPLLVLEFVRSA